MLCVLYLCKVDKVKRYTKMNMNIVMQKEGTILQHPLLSKTPPKLSPHKHSRRFVMTTTYCCSSAQLIKTLSLIQNSAVIACLRANSAELACDAASAALNAGISILEILTSTPGVFEVLQQLVRDHPAKTFGVGTVLNVADARKAVDAGAKFLMSPAMVMDIMDAVQCDGVLYMPGAMTPTEILSAYEAGAKVVKVYPVSALGGVKYISAIKKPFPHIPMVASQGIKIDSIKHYISGGASCVVLSDAIFTKEAMDQKDLNEIHQLAQCASLKGLEAMECLRSNINNQDRLSNGRPTELFQ